jgi:hypothetical protein
MEEDDEQYGEAAQTLNVGAEVVLLARASRASVARSLHP